MRWSAHGPRFARAQTRWRLPVAGVLVLTVSLTGCSWSARTDSGRVAKARFAGAAARPQQPSLVVQAENSKRGTSAWGLTRLGRPHEIEGFATATDVLAGQPVRLAVSTSADSYRLSVFRAGWYGGDLMRQVASAGPFPGRRQPPAKVMTPTFTVTTNWSATTTLDSTGWPPGAYLIRLEASTGAEQYVPITVRSATTAGSLVLIDAVTTWQAYNAWGGYSLYHGPAGGADFTHRSRVVTFDRPYDRNGQADFLGNELPAIALAERLGLRLSYVTDLDLESTPTLLEGARGVVSLGHDEYWSTAMRSAVTAARDHGTNVAFLGANAVFRHIRLAPAALPGVGERPDRLEINYKRRYGDPDNGVHNAEVTVDWREPPLSKPESTLTGALYECNPVKADLIVNNASSWLWKGLAPAGTRVPGIVGSEYDRVNPGDPTPKGIEVLTHSPVTCRHRHSYADSAYYTTPSGAGVFDAGTSLWVAAMNTSCRSCVTSSTGRALITAVTTRLLIAMSQGPLGPEHPAHSNLASLHEYAGDPIAQPVGID